ncbi:hypothetical protein ACWDTG_23790 [Rhodococcus zopfii]
MTITVTKACSTGAAVRRVFVPTVQCYRDLLWRDDSLADVPDYVNRSDERIRHRADRQRDPTGH